MFRRIGVLILLLLLLVNIYGCAALIAGAAGAGTATWFSSKLTQQVKASPEESLEAVKSALASFKSNITKETITEKVIQIKSNYTDGKAIWIDIRPTSKSTSQIDVRVGAVSDKEAAHKILDRILEYL
ncbi:DUF3568 family protein [Candidatus Omnitrophota bacterium]